MADYPGSIHSFTDKTDGVDTYLAADINEAYAEIAALETEIGTDPAGSASDLKTRLAQSLDGLGNLDMNPATTLTLSGGAITAAQNYHLVDTEGAATTDDLETITAAAGGFILFLRIVSDGRNVVIRNNVGNILCAGAADITLDLGADLAVLIYDAVDSKWYAFGLSGAGLLKKANTWTGKQVFSAGFATAVTTVTDDTTLDDTAQTVGVDATSKNIVITLPPVSGLNGTRYDVIKIDSSAHTVTLDGDGSELINGAATYVISNQWTSVTVICSGSAWWII